MIRSFFTCLAFGLILNAPVFAQTQGCTNIFACNFDFFATQDDGSCNFCCEGNVDMSGFGGTFCGCTDPLACNWDPFANLDDASCQYCCPLSNDTIQVFSLGGSQTSNDCGCTNPNACNYDPDASIDDGSCHFLCQYCKEGTIWDDGVQGCIVAKPSDSNFDGCVQLNDLLDLLSAYGDCGDEEPEWQCGEPLGYQGYDYATVQIGEQCWFAENLKAENYENGDFIPNNLTASEWSSTTSGASAVHGEGSHPCFDFAPNGDACDQVFALNEYGRLYNWYAVDSPSGLCPAGWHVASDADWMDLEIHLGMSATELTLVGYRGTNEGNSLKATSGWALSGEGDNSTGFTARPGGIRANAGDTPFVNGGGGASFWTSSASSAETAWNRLLTSITSSAEQIGRSSDSNKRVGQSVRCLKDTQ